VQGAELPALAGWESFYVITGSSAAALTGLMFVVITLVSETRRQQSSDALSAFATPSVVHFGAVLLLAAILSTPGQTALSLSVCLTVCGAAGVVYSTRVIARVVRQHAYEPVFSDWLWYLLLPVVCYLGLLAAAVVLHAHAVVGLYIVGAVDLMLLYVGMHNAWDTAMWMAVHPRTVESNDSVSSADG
jgi:hypothetical protein